MWRKAAGLTTLLVVLAGTGCASHPVANRPVGAKRVAKHEVPAAAYPVDGSTGNLGAIRASGYSTELWTSEEVDNTTGLRVVSTTAAGTFALTGVVVDDRSSDPVSDAVVTLTTACVGCGTLKAV